MHLDPEELAPARSLQQVEVGLHGGLASARRKEVSEHQWRNIVSYNGGINGHDAEKEI